MRDEGYRYSAYRDSVGIWTIGVGHELGAGTLPRMSTITEDEIAALLRYDIDQATSRARSYFPNWVLIDLTRQDALVNMAFNLGNRFGAFTKMHAAINRAMSHLDNEQDWLDAGREMRNSVWANQVGPRAVRLQHMIETGERMS